MLKRRQIRAIRRFIQKLFKTTGKVSLSVLSNMIRTLVRSVFVTTRHRHRRTAAKAGFVLPTVALLLVVVGLVIGAILFRTGSRTNQVINERNQQAIYNAATPAIDRARAKLEYLFKVDKDERLSSGVPDEKQLLSALLNDGQNGVAKVDDSKNPYKFPDETPIQIGSAIAPAWKYQTDVDGDGKPETIAYSILLKTKDPLDGAAQVKREDSGRQKEKEKANKQVVRNGPITIQKVADKACERLGGRQPEAGWDIVTSGSLRKTFQVDAVVVSNKGGNRTVTTLEFQQDREIDRANKWGAWFRYDMHVYPFPTVRWNGAMHTEGSLYLGGQQETSIQSYLISAPKSCLYKPGSNSEITIGLIKKDRKTEFAGQAIKGSIGGTPSSSATVHIHNDDKPIDDSGKEANVKVGDNNDSITSGTPQEIALNPIKLFTEDKSEAIGSDPTNERYSSKEWKDNAVLKNPRISARSEDPPYVDDTYRADDRLGPKPKYKLDGTAPNVILSSSLKNGTRIQNASLTTDQMEQLTRTTALASDLDLKSLGLDGYWERRAKAEGLRIIVGPRLELGNPFGWQGPQDPLYPVYRLGGTISHLRQQQRTLRDNLAAVQATAVYHYSRENGDFPVACMATTAHPGTEATVNDSKNFRAVADFYDSSAPSKKFYSDFFTGKGTNGWEYSIAPQGDFLGGGSPLRRALQNLANFAGDHENNNKTGAFPPTQEGGRVHPDPYLTMWGNFSNLKRALSPDGNNSIADRSYLHTAGCAVGMLAHNIKYFQDFSYPSYSAQLNDLNTALQADFGFGADKGLAATSTPDNYVARLLTAPGVSDDTKKLARLTSPKEQIARDRNFGFAASPGSPLLLDPSVPPLAAVPNKYQYQLRFIGEPDTPGGPAGPAFEYGGKQYTTQGSTDPSNPITKIINVGCDFSPSGNNFFGFGDPIAASSLPAQKDAEKKFIRLATALCSKQPKFPSLYYIFPDASVAGHNRGNNQPPSEPYIQRTNGTIPDANFEQVDIAALASQFQPEDLGSWTLPTGGSPTVNISSLVDNAFQITKPDGTNNMYVPFLDKGIYDGREMMSLRVLDIDLARLKNSSGGVSDWFPKSGVFYAFREDGFREDAIARPPGGIYTDPNNPVKTTATSTDSPTDPEVNANGISPKPVDFYPDPDRRPYGFRLRNGADLRRGGDNWRGITFVSDNTVAIQGDFNLHSQEEFTDTLDKENFRNFYTRPNLNESFATLGGDTWRPAEILADAITLLSNNFVDGSIEQGLSGTGNHSYRGIYNPGSPNWLREDGAVESGPYAIPIKINRNGDACSAAGTPCPTVDLTSSINFASQSRRSNINGAIDTKVNAIFVSGTQPARENQGNGGFHNFPRLLERWSSIPLAISGSFIQLNFSTSATAPYEQDAWEPTVNPTSAENDFYFQPPRRLWGYDVGLQYAPAAPLSKRFITSGSPRSEFYEEPAANDAYICNLRREIVGSPQDGLETTDQVNQECN